MPDFQELFTKESPGKSPTILTCNIICYIW
jgi:hypothetical protein